MGRDLVSIGKEPLLLSLPIYSDKKRESSVVGYSIIRYFHLKLSKINNKKFSRRTPLNNYGNYQHNKLSANNLMIFFDNYQHRKLSANNLIIFFDNYQHRKLFANNLMIFSIIINVANYLQIAY